MLLLSTESRITYIESLISNYLNNAPFYLYAISVCVTPKVQLDLSFHNVLNTETDDNLPLSTITTYC